MTIAFDADRFAADLQKDRGFVLGIRPGKNTADHLRSLNARLAVIGSFYLAIACILPSMVIQSQGLPLVLGGGGLVILVIAVLDTVLRSRAGGGRN
jgi:preprotein translocase subunit SecY